MKKCFLCNKQDNLIYCEDKLICKDCYKKLSLGEASTVAYEEWSISVSRYDSYEGGVDIVIRRIINEIGIEIEIGKQKELLLAKIADMIKLYLRYYQKDELYVTMLTIRELIRRLFLKHKDNLNWIVIGDITTTTTLMSIIRNISYDEFENNPVGEFEDGASNLITAICLARRYDMIRENIQLTRDKIISIAEICFYPIETDETENYFKQFIKNGMAEKPEDYIVKNEALKNKLIKEGKTPDSIIDGLQDVIKEEFGFERKEYSKLLTCLMRIEFPTEEVFIEYIENDNKLFDNIPLFIIEKDIVAEICGRECLEALLNVFSINRNIDNHEFDKELELLSFYEIEELIIFGNFDFAQNISAFEKFLISKDYIDIYKKSLLKNSMLTKAQKKLSQYLSISVADYLYSMGYKLPMEKYQNTLIPRAEIDKIKVNGKDLLAECGDIDVLTLDTNNKEVLLFEIKYYKPAITAMDMLYKDEERIEEDEVIRKMQRREDVVSINIDEIVKYVLGEYQYGYKVKSIFLTPRTNYFAIKEDKINYLTWAEFIEKVEEHNLLNFESKRH